MQTFLKLTLISTALLLTVCSSISKEPVKHIDMYVKPYYDARDGRLEQINVNKDIDALLLKNTQKILKVRLILLKKVDFVSPMTMFALSARAYDFGLRDEAVKWFYRGQNRLITALYVLDLDKLTVSNNTAFGQLVGQHVNPYAFCDLNKQHKAAQDAIDWVKKSPVSDCIFTSITKQTSR